MKENGKATKYQDHDKTNPLHGINFAMTIVNPENLTNRCDHCNNRSGIDITELESNEEQDNREEVE